MTDLHDLLDRSTDRIESPDLVGRALLGARRRRTTRAGVVAGGVAATLVAGVLVVTQLGASGPDSSGPVTPPTGTTPTEQPLPTAAVTQSPWKPRNVDLPSAADDVAPLLPDVIEPPQLVPWLADDPIDAAVIALGTEDSVSLLATDGGWRSVPLVGDYGGAELTRDGTRLAVSTESGVDVWDLATGEMRQFARPAGFPDVDSLYGWWRWLDGETLLLRGRPEGGGWLVDALTGEVTEVPYPRGGGDVTYWSVDDAGVVIESSWTLEGAELVDWAGGTTRSVDVTADGRLGTPQATADTIATTRGYSVVVLDRDDLATRYELPFVDNNSNFVDGRMSVVALLQDETVLIQVPKVEPTDSWRIVAWQPSTGDLSLVTSGADAVPAAYAVGLLG